MCKSRVDAPSYRNNKSSVDASGTMSCRVIGSMLLACETIPAGLMLYGWNICKSRVDTPRYKNSKSSVVVSGIVS
jgi:hypothetical protein